MGSQAEYFSKCRTPCRTHERYGRLAVSSLPRFEQLAVMPQSLSGFDADSRALCQGSFCRQTEHPAASVLQLEARSVLALEVDALQQDWSKEKNYAFPPFCLIMRVLAKLREQGGELILVTPLWPTQAWYPTLLDMSVSLPVLLPMSTSLLFGLKGRHTRRF